MVTKDGCSAFYTTFIACACFIGAMLFKWLFTLLAILWVWMVWRRYFAPPAEANGQAALPEEALAPEPAPEPEPKPMLSVGPRADDGDEGEYIEYEEVKE